VTVSIFSCKIIKKI